MSDDILDCPNDISYHPMVLDLLSFNNGVPLCPFLKHKMEWNHYSMFNCDCSKSVALWSDTLASDSKQFNRIGYEIFLNARLRAHITIICSAGSTIIHLGENEFIDVPHTNFPFFNELALRSKLKVYLPFL